MLPGTDGITLMKSIREMADVPVIFISAYGQDQVIVRAFEVGSTDYVVKPFSPTELAARIQAALRRRAVPALDAPSEFVVDVNSNRCMEKRVLHLLQVSQRLAAVIHYFENDSDLSLVLDLI